MGHTLIRIARLDFQSTQRARHTYLKGIDYILWSEADLVKQLYLGPRSLDIDIIIILHQMNACITSYKYNYQYV